MTSKALPTGRSIGTTFDANWGAVAAVGAAASRFFLRTNTLAGGTAAAAAEYPCSIAGTFVFTVTARVSGTQLATDTVTIEIFKNGAASGISFALSPGEAFDQASGSLAVVVGDGISVRATQSSTEAQAAWNANVNVRAQAA